MFPPRVDQLLGVYQGLSVSPFIFGESGVWLNLSWRCGSPCQTSSSVLSAIKTNKQTHQRIAWKAPIHLSKYTILAVWARSVKNICPIITRPSAKVFFFFRCFKSDLNKISHKDITFDWRIATAKHLRNKKWILV